MRKILNWLVTPHYCLLFGGILCFFHPFLVIANLVGYHAHKVVLEWMNYCLILNFRTAGARVRIDYDGTLPPGRPMILVSNHQSMYDIPLLLWTFRQHHPKFIAKVELSRGIPSISFALRHMGSVLIDRGSQSQAVRAIEDFGKRIAAAGYMACIFPEGTRTKDGEMRKFKRSGFVTLLKSMPDALIVPVTLDGTFKMTRYKLMPVGFGAHLSLKTLTPIEPAGLDPEVLLGLAESQIQGSLKSTRAGQSPHNYL